MWTLFAAATVAHASAFVELDYAPIGRGDLAWNDAGQQSGTLVSEGDGIVVPPLRVKLVEVLQHLPLDPVVKRWR